MILQPLSNWLSGSGRFARRFEAARRLAPDGPLRAFYDAGYPTFSTPLAQVPLVALDLETDGLDFRGSAILEAGLVEMAHDRIFAGTGKRIRIRPPEALSEQSVVIHRITDDALAGELDEAEALSRLLPLLAGKPVVAHFSEIESGFLDAACRRVFGAPFVAPFICTMALENRWFPRQRAADGLRLAKLRAGYGLPAYRAHDGLVDALACGELLVAQIAAHGNAPTLGDVIRS
ncbi:exonuclease domain-containing protein [Croceicoccus bisphenolivorans]|uniref:exonuclease domain-containing protein n=1 Tax=Croceicoccus bisphenolivorans TaxID=1783232 RepID=UPI000B2E5B7A|nr:exonuclease domain-containing protein [Croceicoccus bisphenolivorans]